MIVSLHSGALLSSRSCTFNTQLSRMKLLLAMQRSAPRIIETKLRCGWGLLWDFLEHFLSKYKRFDALYFLSPHLEISAIWACRQQAVHLHDLMEEDETNKEFLWNMTKGGATDLCFSKIFEEPPGKFDWNFQEIFVRHTSLNISLLESTWCKMAVTANQQQSTQKWWMALNII